MSKKDNWFRLDNAAKIFPSIITNRTTTVFRVSCTLTEYIDPNLLSVSLNKIIERFPYYKVQLKSGIFWHYLQNNNLKLLVFPEVDDPCRKISFKKNNKFLFRVLYYKNRISVEFSHILTDGTGALIFLKSLVVEYLSAKGISIADYKGIFKVEEKPDPEEFEDSYKKHYNSKIPKPLKKEKAFHINERLEDRSVYNIITGIVETDEFLKVCRDKNVSITEYISATYLYSLYSYMKEKYQLKENSSFKPIRVMIPVNLRKIYKSRSMRNFFLTVTPEIDPRLGDYTFDEILQNVYHYMRVEVNDKFISRLIKRNVRGETHPFIRIVPLFMKIPVEQIIYTTMSANEHSGVITNLGRVDMPDEIADYIERFEFIPNPNPATKKNMGIISFDNKLYITFASMIKNTEIEKIFFRLLRKQGLHVKIEAN